MPRWLVINLLSFLYLWNFEFWLISCMLLCNFKRVSAILFVLNGILMSNDQVVHAFLFVSLEMYFYFIWVQSLTCCGSFSNHRLALASKKCARVVWEVNNKIFFHLINYWFLIFKKICCMICLTLHQKHLKRMLHSQVFGKFHPHGVYGFTSLNGSGNCWVYFCWTY